MGYGMFPTLLVDGKHGALWMMLQQNGDLWVIGKDCLQNVWSFVFTWEVCAIIYINVKLDWCRKGSSDNTSRKTIDSRPGHVYALKAVHLIFVEHNIGLFFCCQVVLWICGTLWTTVVHYELRAQKSDHRRRKCEIEKKASLKKGFWEIFLWARLKFDSIWAQVSSKFHPWYRSHGRSLVVVW